MKKITIKESNIKMKTIPIKSQIYFVTAGKEKLPGKRLLVLMIGCLLLMQAQAQADKRLVLADQYFASGEYFTAAGLYGQFLSAVVKTKPPSDFPLNSKKNTEGKTGTYKDKTDILFKQAES